MKKKNVLRSSLSSFDSDEIGLLQLTKQLSVLSKTLELDERSREGFMKKQIERIFPCELWEDVDHAIQFFLK